MIHTQIQELLAIIITTSPIPSHPSTEIIDMAIQSIDRQPSLEGAKIYIICDGVKISEDNINKYKSGIISQAMQLNYHAYKQKLKSTYGVQDRFVIIEREKRCCFAANIQYVMSMILHPYVLIFQHDHILTRPVPFNSLVNCLHTHSQINYIGMINSSAFKIQHQLDHNLKIRNYWMKKIEYQSKEGWNHQKYIESILEYHHNNFGLPLMPLMFWYDKVHIARKSYYLNVIFSEEGFFDKRKQKQLKTVSFVEDSFGIYMKHAIKDQPQLFQYFGAYIYWDALESAIMHTHGRAYLTQELKGQIYQPNPNAVKQSSSESEQDQQPYGLQFLQESE